MTTSPVSKRAVVFSFAFLAIASMGVLHRLAYSYGMPNFIWTDPVLEQIKRDIIPPARRTNERRKSILRRICNESGGRIPRLSKDTYDVFAKFIIVDRERQIMYCPVPKAACTTWKAFFMELHGVTLTNDIHRQERDSVVHLSDLSAREVETVLRNYTKFMIARHPFTRVLSAYRNKLEPGGSYETAHAENEDLIYYWRDQVGTAIVKKYRGSKMAKRFKEHREEYELTFEEFADFISDHKDLMKANNRHWMEVHSICYPCDIEYDYVAKVETLTNDSLLFLVDNGLSTHHVTNHGQHATHSSTSSAVAQFYNRLPVETIEKLYRRYEMDFRLFDYSEKLMD